MNEEILEQVELEDNDTNWICPCGKNCLEGEHDYYMLNHDIWIQINGKKDGMLCMNCVEEKLGRKLEANDILPCYLTLFENEYTKDIMLKSGYKLTLDDLYTFSMNVFEEDLEKIFQFYHTKRLYKFFSELSEHLEMCKDVIKDVEGYETEEMCLCPECIFEEIIFMNIRYGMQRTDNGKN